MVSALSMVFMGVSAAISFGVPVALFFVWRKKHNLEVIPLLVGMAGFIVFALILESILHSIVLHPNADGTIDLMQKPLLYCLYAAFAAGIFEETARFICFHLLKKKYSGFGTGLAYGIGHGGIEAILLCGLTMISNLVLCVSIIAGGSNAELLLSQPAVASAIDSIAAAPAPLFLVGGLERIFAITLHISLSVLVWMAVNKTGKMWFFPLAILLHALLDIPAAMLQCGILNSIPLVEVLVGILAVLSALITYFLYRKTPVPSEKLTTDNELTKEN